MNIIFQNFSVDKAQILGKGFSTPPLALFYNPRYETHGQYVNNYAIATTIRCRAVSYGAVRHHTVTLAHCNAKHAATHPV